MDFNRDVEISLIAALRTSRAELTKLLEDCSNHWGYEDPIYRFYHQSFKVFFLQEQTAAIVKMLRSLAPEQTLDRWFVEIVNDGTGKCFDLKDNANWPAVTRPIVEAFFHARYFLEMAVRYSILEEPPSPLPSGYAAILSLYGLR